MLGRRAKLPVLAELGDGKPAEGRVWALQRADLDALGKVLDGLDGKSSVLVTGGEQGVGAVAVGLAAAAAAGGQRVALLECELQRPRIAAALGLAASPGLHEYLRGEVEAREILQPLVPAGPASRRALDPLVCIAAGVPGGENGAAPQAAEGFRHAVAKLKHGYDLLILAGPWLDGGEALRAVSAEAEATLVCVPPERLAGRSGRSVQAVLKGLAAPVAGAVLVDQRS
jgi:Mrp family chromosome partitioning ATPase